MAERCLLYYITDRIAFAPDEPTRRQRLLEKIAEAARGGVDYIQLREKDLSTRDLESLAREAASTISKLRSENPQLKTALLVNSRTDIALATGADGVHLRSDDISPQEVKSIWKECAAVQCGPFDKLRTGSARQLPPQTPLIGVSCHSPAEVTQAAVNGASFTVFAPVFGKKDVPDVRPAGLKMLRQACQANIQVLALGGITLDNAHSCLEAGAAGIAAIRLFQEHHISEVVRRLRSNF